MIIECSYCDAKVDGKIIGTHEGYIDECPYPYKTIFLECPICKNALLGGQVGYETDDRCVWEFDRRLWPKPENDFSYLIPSIVRTSLEEAQKCFIAKAYSACAVMCGRSLEGICKEHDTKSKILSGGLKELLDRKVIDDRLFSWGEALREQRNLGAHASGEDISKDDARDLLDFVIAICDYVFVLNDKYEKFLERQEEKQNQAEDEIPF